MKNIVVFLCLLSCLAGQSQYYYNDILGARDLSEKVKTYSTTKVKSVTATGFEPGGSKSPDFNEWQELRSNPLTLVLTTRNEQTFTRQYYKFDEKYRLISILDSNGLVASRTIYQYDSGDRITLIHAQLIDSLNDFIKIEDRVWKYDDKGMPSRMYRILDGKDSTEYRFSPDEHGNTGSEQLFRRNVGYEEVLYYYDDGRKLTDIVRFNKKANRLLPDFMFEYDENGRLAQKTTTLSTTGRDYLNWRFLYNDKGLKTKEALFNKLKEAKGTIVYTYSFNP